MNSTGREKMLCVFSTLDMKLKHELSKLDLEFFPFPWSLKDWEELLADFYEVVISKDFLGHTQGFCLFSLDRVSSQVCLLKILTTKSFRSKGVAQALLAKSIAHYKNQGFKSVYLEVSVHNVSAIKLYEKNGFRPLVLKKKFYSNGCDAYAMQLCL